MESRQNVILNAIESIAKREGIVDPKIKILDGCGKGNGYAGEKIIAILSGDNKIVEVFIKGSPVDGKLKQAFNTRGIFLLEIFFYTEIFPAFLKFQQAKRVPKPFTSILQCLETRTDLDNELILLQNARKLGYEVWDRSKQMNREHVEFVFTEYGKYHGLSYALKDQQPDVYYGLIKKFPLDASELVVEIMVKGVRTMAEKALLLFDPVQDADVYRAYEKFVEEYADFMTSIPHQRNDYSVIIHGDCWCTNMMFKYRNDPKNNTKPEDMVLLDFQLVREGSPVLDLSYFMYCSSSKEVYKNLDHYLEIYHNSLSETVRALGSDPEVVFPYKEFKKQWKLNSKFGLVMAVVNLKACVQDDDETMELSDALGHNEEGDMMAGFRQESRNEPLYQQRLKDLIVNLAENEFI